MSGEILRAVLDKNSKAQRLKYYQTDLTFAQPVTQGRFDVNFYRNSIKVESDTAFLAMNVSVVFPPVFTDQQAFTLRFRNLTDAQWHNDGLAVVTSIGSTITEAADLPSYVLFDSNDFIDIELQAIATTAAVNPIRCYIVFGGIEYRI